MILYENKRARKSFFIIVIILICIGNISGYFMNKIETKISGQAYNGNKDSGHYYALSFDNKLQEISSSDWYLNIALFVVSIIGEVLGTLLGVLFLIIFFMYPVIVKKKSFTSLFSENEE